MMRLLIIEDEEDLLKALLHGFKKLGYIADGSADGREGLEMAQLGGYDLIVLDLNLPGIDGIDILREIKVTDAMQKILILSARSDYPERIRGLDLGANDYLVKPFDFGELEARVRSLLRRNFMQNDAVIYCSGFSLDTAKRRVYTKDGQTVELAPKEYGIFEYLALHRGMPVSAEELIRHLWEEDADMFSNAVKVHISGLRRKLGAFSKENIITNIRGVGYIIDE
jgi:DNA-binding response OmpR family regulator